MFKCDNSLLVDRAECVAKAVLKHALHRDSKEFKEAAEVGNMFHRCFEMHFRGGDSGSVMATFDEEYARLFPMERPPTKDRFSKPNLQIILEEYIKNNPVDEYLFRPLHFEEVHGFDLTDGIRFYVKRDMLVEEKASGLVMPLDHKTTRLLRDWWKKKWRFSSQILGYAWAVERETGVLPPQVAVNAVELGLLPRSARNCKLHKMKFAQCYRLHVNYQILKYTILPEMVENWKATAILQATQARTEFAAYGSVEMLPYAPRTGYFTGACTFCELKKACRMGFTQAALDNLTVPYRWAPWNEAVGEAVVVDSEPAPAIGAEVVQEPEVLGASASPESDYTWYFNPQTQGIWVSKVPLLGGMTAMPEPMALKALWQQGKEAWMQIWKTYPFVQQAMVEFGKQQEGGQ